ncbi:MAG: sugar phosphate permease [Deltaproteobacteria bacterium]|nr:sugar phosphate permease [Deltaproteobacteria bacterium]
MMVHYAWVIAFTGTLVLMLTQGFGRMSYSVILPSMKDGLLLTYTQVGLIGTANFVGYLSLAVVGGFLAVRFGTRRTIFVSLLAMGVSLFLTGLSRSFTSAFLMRLITGMGNGAAVVPMMALTASWFAARKRGLAAGILTMGTGFGLSIVGVALPYVMAKFGPDGWRYAWFLLGSVVFIFSFLCYALLRDYPAEKGTSMYGGEEEQKSRKAVTFFSAWGDVVRESEIWKLGIVYFMFGFSYIIYITFFVAYLTTEGALTPQKAGQIFAVLGLWSILSGAVWGWISDVLGRRLGLLLAYLTIALSFLIIALWRSTTGFYVSSIVFGLSLSSIPAIMAAAVGDSVGGRLAPAALGFITLIFGIGQSLGPAVAGWIKDATGTFAGAFILSAVVSLIGAAGSMLLRKKT